MRLIASLPLLLLMFAGAASCAPVISNLIDAPKGYVATITWDTDIATNNSVKYSVNADMSSPSWTSWTNNTTSIDLDMEDLTLNITYYYQAFAYNFSNNADYSNSTMQSFSSVPKYHVQKNTSVTLHWDTNGSAMTGQIEYGLDTSYGTTIEEAGFSYFHILEITGLSDETTYHYRLIEKDIDAMQTTSPDMTFTTINSTQMDDLVKAARADGQLPKTYYLSPSGDNADNGLTLGTAWKTPNHASQQVDAGDTVYCINGTWNGTGTIDCYMYLFAHNGIATHPIIFKAYNGTPYFMAARIAPSAPLGTSHITYDGLKMSGTGGTGHVVNIVSVDHITLLNCTFFYPVNDSGGETIYTLNTEYTTIDNCTAYNSGWNGIKITGNTAADQLYYTVKNTEIYDIPGHNGMSGGGTNVLIDNCNLHDIDLAAYKVYGNRVVISNSIGLVSNNGVTVTSDSSDYLVYNSTFDMPIWLTGDMTDFTVYDCKVTRNNYDIWVVQGSVLFRDNEIRRTSSNGGYYTVQTADIIIRDEKASPILAWIQQAGGNIIVEYTDGKVFTIDGGFEPKYYSDRSNFSFSTGTRIFTHYNVTLTPTSSYLKNVTVTHESDAADDRTNISVNSNTSTNPTWINATMQNASANYSVSVDGSIVDYVDADSSGIVRYQYTSSWSSHDFEFNWVSAGAFSADHTKAYYNSTSAILNTVNSTGYYVWDRTITANDNEISSGSMKVTT